MMNQPVAFVDTETTGLDPALCPIWEVAVIVDDEEHCWQVSTQPLMYRAKGVPAPKFSYLDEYADEVCRFTERHRQVDALTPLESAERFTDLVDGRHLVGAVISFDEERLRLLHDRELGKPGRYPWHYHLIDVEALAIGYIAGAGGHVPPLPWRSDELGLALGVEPLSDEERHTALGDARWAKAIYERIMGAAS